MNEQVSDGVLSSHVKAHTEKLLWGEYRQEREAETDGELLFINMKTNQNVFRNECKLDHSGNEY